MSILKRGMALDSSAGRERPRFGGLARWGALGLMALCASVTSAGKANAADSAVEALIGNAVDLANSGTMYSDVGEAITRFNHNDLSGARTFLKQAKSDHKSLPPAELMLAQLLAAANQGQLAREELENCVKLHSEDPEAFLIFGDQAFAERRFTDAALLFGQAKTLAANFTENKKRQRNFQIRAEAGLAAVGESREQWDDAKAHLDAWLVIDSKSANAHDRLGRVLFRSDKTTNHEAAAKAYDQFKQAVEADDKSISADIALAQLYEEAKDHAMATKFIRRAVATPPADPTTKLATMIAAAHWALETDMATEARDYSDLALKADPTSAEAKFLRGVSARLLEDTETAEKYLQEVYAASPINFSASNQYAQVLAEQVNKEKRQKALEIARINDKMYGGQKNVQGIETAATLGWVLYQMGNINQADQVMQAIVQTGSPSADSLYYRARILQEVGKTEDAAKYLKVALQISKNFVHHKKAQEMAKRLGVDLEESKEPKKSSADSDTSKTDASGSGKTDVGKNGVGK